MKKRKSVWTLDMFHRNIGNSRNYFDELFQNLEKECQKMEELPDERQENRSKKIIDDLLTGYGLGVMLEQHETRQE